MRHQRDRKGHKGKGQSLFEAQAWGRNLSRTPIPEQPQGIAQSLAQVRGAAELPQVGGEVSTSTAIPGHESHEERLPATEDQLCVVPIEVHLRTQGHKGPGLGYQAHRPSQNPGAYPTFPPELGRALTWTVPSLKSMSRA